MVFFLVSSYWEILLTSDEARYVHEMRFKLKDVEIYVRTMDWDPLDYMHPMDFLIKYL